MVATCQVSLSHIVIIVILRCSDSDELNLPYNPGKLTHECPSDILVKDEAGVKITGEISGAE